MKRILILIACCCMSVLSLAQETRDSLYVSDQVQTVKLDSASFATLSAIKNLVIPRYKMYKTENTYILLKLDTATGEVWMVQYGMGATEAMTIEIDGYPLVYSWQEHIPGRFELYPTNNMYNFILLDTIYGHTYQVQWNTDSRKRFRERIF